MATIPASATALAEQRAMDALRRLVRAIGTSARAAQGGAGTRVPALSGAQLFVLRQVAAAPGLSVGELARRTFARQSTVSEVVARLVERGLVERRASARDARQVELTLTGRGQRAAERAAPTVQERLVAGLAALPPARRRALADALEGWIEAAGLGEVPPTMFHERAGDA